MAFGLSHKIIPQSNSVPITSVDVSQLRDPKDAMIVAIALSVITGDRDLLLLGDFAGIPF